jgi:invasion protein IalB
VFQRILLGRDKAQTVALTTVLHPARLNDKPATGMRLVTPLGTALTPGMAIKIDDGKDIKVPYTQCLPVGCLVDMVFDAAMLDKIRTGKILFVAYRGPDGKDSTLKVSLKGLAPALDALAQTVSKG